MKISDCYKIGFVAKSHGLKGQVTVSLDPEMPNDFATVESLFIGDGESLFPYAIEAASVTGNKAFVKFRDLDKIEDAENIIGKSLFLPKTARPKPEGGEFYDDEIMGFSVIDETAGPLGIIIDVMTAGPNRLLVMEYQEKEVLIPIKSPFIKTISRTEKTLSVTLPDGFLDI